jgi:hypothetical protein
VSDKLYAFTADPNKPLREAHEEIDRLRAERDEARREVCVWQGLDTGNTPRDTATVRGWDCYTRYDK